MPNKRTPKNKQAANTFGLTATQVARLEEAYTTTHLTLTELQRAFMLTRRQLQTLCTEHGWTRRRNVSKQLHRKQYATGERSKDNGIANRDLNTLKRCTRLLLECQMRGIERECTNNDGAPTPRNAADREKDARTLANLTRTLEKLTELEHADAQAPAQGLVTEKNVALTLADDTGKSIDEIRLDIEHRLHQLIDKDDA